MGMFMHRNMNLLLRVLVVCFGVWYTLFLSTQTVNAQETTLPIGPSGSPSVDAFVNPNNDIPIRPVLNEDNNNPNVGGDAGAGGGGTETTNEPDETESKIYNAAVSLGGWIAGLGGAIFDLAIDRVVLRMGCWFTDDPKAVQNADCADIPLGQIGGVVNALWTVVRDLFNVLFIFALVWIGLRTILFTDDTQTKRALGLLIVAALLINFSLYFSKVIVDVANYTAVSIHAVATSGISNPDGFGFGTQPKGNDKNAAATSYKVTGQSLSAAYMQALRISSWFSGSPVKNIILFSIVVVIFSIILGMTLAYGGLMLIARFVALIIFMIFSPAMFLGWVLPNFKKYADMWWSKFLSYSFFAPAYIFMLYLGLFTLIQMENMFANTSYSAAFGTSWTPDTFTIFLFFAIGIAFLLAATKVGEQMSRNGSTMAANGLNKVKGWGLGFAYRNTVGRGMNHVIKGRDALDRRFQQSEAKDKERSRIGRIGMRTLRGATKGVVVGGEHRRRAMVNMRDKNVGDYGYTEGVSAEKERKERNAKEIKQREVLQTLQETTEQSPYSANTKRRVSYLTTSEVDEIAKDSKKKNLLIQNASYLNENHLKKLENDHPELYNQIMERRSKNQKRWFQADPVQFISSLSKKDFANVDKSILEDKSFIQALQNHPDHPLSAEVLSQIAKSKAHKRTIGQHVIEVYGAEKDPMRLPADIFGFMTSGAGAQFLPEDYHIRMNNATRKQSQPKNTASTLHSRGATYQKRRNHPIK